MNEKAVFEIGNIIHIRRTFLLRSLSAKEIIEHCEYEWFKEKYPELCKLAEEGIGDNKPSSKPSQENIK